MCGAASWPYFFWYAKEYPSDIGSDFFATSAQVIPVFMLALTIDVGRSKQLEGADMAWTIFGTLVGEITALGASAFDPFRNRGNFAIVAASLVTLFLALAMAITSEIGTTSLSSNTADTAGEGTGSRSRPDIAESEH